MLQVISGLALTWPLSDKPTMIRSRLPPRLRLQPRRPRGRPKTEDIEALEARLVSVARQAFLLNGYGATSINAIAKSARVSKNTLYARFPSKAALFQVIVAGQIAGVDQELRPSSASASEGDSLGDRLQTYLNVAMRRSFSKEVLEINRLIASESFQFPELGEAARTRFWIGVEHVARVIEVFAERDGIPCKDPLAAAEILLSGVYGWYNLALIANRTVTERERLAWVDNIVGIFLASRSRW